MCEDLLEGSGSGILCVSVGSGCKQVRVQAGPDVVFNVLENQPLEAGGNTPVTVKC